MTQCIAKVFLSTGRSCLRNSSSNRGPVFFARDHSSKSTILQPDTSNSGNAPKRAQHTVFVPDKERPKRKVKENVKEGLEVLRHGIPEWKQEWKDRIECDYKFVESHGDYEYLAKFDNADTVNKWVVTTDADNNMGKSNAAFTLTESKTALFHGFLNTEPPKDGKNRAAGFCNVRCPRNRKSFERVIPYDWSRYTHLYLKVRGDGRNYMLGLNMDYYYDLHWYDMHQFPLFTRGGPYWQIVKVPFSKFFLSHSARVQDVQEPPNLERVKYFHVCIMDTFKGRFQLEIDSIAVVRDESENNIFDYEMYDTRFI